MRLHLLVTAALLLAAAGFLVGWTARARAAQAAERARQAERARLRAEGLLAAERASRARLEREARGLREQLERVRRAAPRSRVREVTRWRTREIPLPCPPGGAAGKDEVPPSGGLPGKGLSAATGSALRIQLTGSEARLETRAGQTVAVGQVEVWRTSPPPRELLAREPLAFRLHLEEGRKEPRGWAAGPAFGLIDGSWAWGATVAGPPIRLGRVEARPLAVALFGGGEWTVAGAAVIGW